METTPCALALRLAGLAAVAVTLALAPSAGAATATRPAAAQAKPATTPARPSAMPVAISPAAHPPASARAPAGVTWFGGAIGALSGAVAAQLDVGVLRTPAAWSRFDLEWHVVAAFAAPKGTTQLTATVTPPLGAGSVQVNAGQEKKKALLFEVVPTARVLWTATRGVAFFCDAGVGVAQSIESYDRSEMFVGHSTHKEYATGFVVRLGGGLAADVTPRWRVVFEPLAFDLMVGPKFSSWTPTLGVAYRL